MPGDPRNSGSSSIRVGHHRPSVGVAFSDPSGHRDHGQRQDGAGCEYRKALLVATSGERSERSSRVGQALTVNWFFGPVTLILSRHNRGQVAATCG